MSAVGGVGAGGSVSAAAGRDRRAMLALEDGRVFHGTRFGAEGTRDGEVVFNTSMTGYQEIITDPSYKGQLVCMTYPLIGNYGINDEDPESAGPQTEGFIIKELSPIVSNWRATGDLSTYLRAAGVIGIEGIDTRALTRHIRRAGTLKAILTTEDMSEADAVALADRSPGLMGRDLVAAVTCAAPYAWNTEGAYHVVAVDCGIKTNILRLLAARGCRVTVVPASTPAADILALGPDGLFLSNGPGDPDGPVYLIEAVRELVGALPVFGICLGQQITALAAGGECYKLKFGHHGGNHPVKDLASGAVAITSQNHGFAVRLDSLPGDYRLTQVNLNDGTVEGIEHRELPVYAIQYHPEAAPGPHDARPLFDRFIADMAEAR